MGSIGRIFSARNLVIGSALLFLVVFVLFPLVLLVLRSFLGTEGEISLQNYIAVYGKESNWDAVVTTLLVCGLTMFFSMIFATGLAWLVVRSNLPWRRQFRSLFSSPM